MRVDPKFWVLDDPVDDRLADFKISAGRDAQPLTSNPKRKMREPAFIVFNVIRDRYEPVVDETGEDS